MTNMAAAPAGALENTAPRAKKGGNTRLVWAVCIALFLASVALRFWMGDFAKKISIYPDELRYFDIARSLWNGKGALVHGIPTDFQKILYSLLIAPAFAFKDTAAQLTAIAFINSVLASSVVFPVLLFARRLLRTDFAIIAALVVAVTLPDLAFAGTFMSEVSGLPFTLWVFWLLWQTTQQACKKRAAVFGAASGAACYLLYLNREIALAYVIAFVLLCAYSLAVEKAQRRATLFALGGFLAAFFVLFLLLKFTLFAGYGNSYDQSSLDVLGDAFTVYYLFYALICNTLMVVAAFFVLPVLLPLFRLRSLGREEKNLYLLALLALAVSIGTITFTISIREDLGAAMPRQHLRYNTPLFLLFLVLFLHVVERLGELHVRRRGRSVARCAVCVVTSVFCCAAIALLNAPSAVLVDGPMLNWLGIFTSPRWFPFIEDQHGNVALYSGILVLRVLVAVAVPLCLWLLLRKNKKAVGYALLVAMLAINLFNTRQLQQGIVENYSAGPEDIAAVAVLNEALEGLDGTVLVILDPQYAQYANTVLNTYLERDVLYTLPNVFGLLVERSGGEYADFAAEPKWILDPVPKGSGYKGDFSAIDYIVVVNGSFIPQADSVEEMELAGGGAYALYRNLDTGRIVPAVE